MLGIVIVTVNLPVEQKRILQSLEDSEITIPYYVSLVNETSYPDKDNIQNFNVSKARNIGIRDCLDKGCSIIATVDGDLVWCNGLAEYLYQYTTDSSFIWVRRRDIKSYDKAKVKDYLSLPLHKGGWGSLISAVLSTWLKVGGYDERCFGWGAEDNIIHKRLQKVANRIDVTAFPLVHVDHPDRVWKAKGKRALQNMLLLNSRQPNYLRPQPAEPEPKQIQKVEIVTQEQVDDTKAIVLTYIESEADSNELRYALRSICQNLPEANIYLIGDKPKWYKGKHIEHKRLSYRPERNYLDAQDKLIKSCGLLTGFVWWYDDLFLLKPTSYDYFAIPTYNPIAVKVLASTHNRILRRTIDLLKKNNRPCFNYSTHMPRYFDSKKLLDLTALGWGKSPALLTDTLYRNMYYDCPTGAINEGIQHRVKRKSSTDRARQSIAVNKPIILNTMAGSFRIAEPILREIFPNKCRYEQ